MNEACIHLRVLVEALDGAFISTWQSTATGPSLSPDGTVRRVHRTTRALHVAAAYQPTQGPLMDDDEEYLGHVACWGCGGSGSRVFCMDDLCRNAGECMHGDGEEMCPECQGEGSA